MTRPLRIDIENGIDHVTSRGGERRVIVRDDHDRDKCDQLLDRVANRFGWRFFAWALMDKHFHLFVQTSGANLSAGMHDLNSG
ncbi:MAG: transposase [Paracoccaceae bacterium]